MVAFDTSRRFESDQKAAGYQPFREVAKCGAIPLGGAVLTSAGRLPFKGIIHVAVLACGGDRLSFRFVSRAGMHCE